MGLFSGLFSGPPGVDVMRLDIFMQYSVIHGTGSAAPRWSDFSISSEALLNSLAGVGMQCELVALLYGRILCIHEETRAELFHRVDSLAKENVRTEGKTGFEFEPWVLRVGFGGGDHSLWPWHLTSPSHLSGPKAYSAVLKLGKPSRVAPLGRWMRLDMSLGQERILAPSSALIAITALSRECDQETRYTLALMLWQMNAYWGSPQQVSLESEARAYAAARNAMKSGMLEMPD